MKLQNFSMLPWVRIAIDNCWLIYSYWLQVPLKVVEPLDERKLDGLKLSLSGDHQFTNAGLAVSLCKCWLQRTGNWEKILQNVSVTQAFVIHQIKWYVNLFSHHVNRCIYADMFAHPFKCKHNLIFFCICMCSWTKANMLISSVWYVPDILFSSAAPNRS